MLKLGVIGTNIITDQMLDAAKTTGKYELTAVYSRTLEHAEKFGEPYGATEFYDDMKRATLMLFILLHQIVYIINKHGKQSKMINLSLLKNQPS